MARDGDGYGPEVRCGPRRMEKARLLAFAAAFDPQPVHTDERAAAASPLKGLAASGWHTLALVTLDLEQALASAGTVCSIVAIDDLRWLKPVRPGDDLFARLQWTANQPCSCSPEGERRSARVEAFNQLDEVVALWRCELLMAPTGCNAVARVGGPTSQCHIRRPRSAKQAPRRGEHFIKYFEDVVCGDATDLGCYVFDRSKVSLYDSIINGRDHAEQAVDVSGWNLLAAWMRLIVDYYDRHARRLSAAGRPVPVLGPATGVKWLRWPTRVSVGEHVHFRSWVEHKVNIGSADRWGLLVAGGEGRNARGEVVISFYPQFLLERRPGEERRLVGIGRDD